MVIVKIVSYKNLNLNIRFLQGILLYFPQVLVYHKSANNRIVGASYGILFLIFTECHAT